jgi:tripartite-type tricarboxylate transporter receptor subunit TctC
MAPKYKTKDEKQNAKLIFEREKEEGNMKGKTIIYFAAASLAYLGILASAAAAGFPEKDITFIIPYSPGGGMDSTARQIAKVMPKYLPNNVNVVPKNVPGAGGRKGYSVLAKSKPDGYTICVINMPGAAIPQLIGEKVNYDLAKFVWVGRMSTSPYLFGVNSKSSIKTFADLKKLAKPLKIGSTGFGTTVYAGASVMKEVIGFKVNFLTGYKSSKAFMVGVVRGDADGAVAPVQSFAKFIKAGDVRGIVTFEKKSSVPGVPTISEVGYPQLTGLGVERMVAAPPGTPKNIRDILSDALVKAAADADSQAWAKKTRRPFSALSGEDTQAAVNNALAMFKKYPKALERQ